jgi:soluble lytic murein transglycosylase-like protein
VRRASLVMVATAVAASMLGAPASARPADAAPPDTTGGYATATSGTGDDLRTTRDELERADRELAAVQAAVRRAGDTVAAADDRSRQATTELERVRSELTDAGAAANAAHVAERDATARLRTLGEELEVLTGRHRDRREQLRTQAVTAFKRGGATTTGLWFSGVVQADDWHEVAIAHGTVARMLDDQRSAVAADAELTLVTAAANVDVADARRDAVRTARAATVERRRVADLAVVQERLVATVAHERAGRAEALAELEADAAARTVLVRDLGARVERLEAAASAVRVPVVALPAGGAPPAWAAGLPAHGRPWAAAIDAAAQANGVDGRLLAVLVWAESNFRPEAVSHAGALGLTQLMPGTARGLGVDPRDPTANLAGGARYLAAQLDAFGRVDLALAAYNAGPARVEQAGRAVPDIVETQLYVARVLERYETLRSR